MAELSGASYDGDGLVVTGGVAGLSGSGVPAVCGSGRVFDLYARYLAVNAAAAPSARVETFASFIFGDADLRMRDFVVSALLASSCGVGGVANDGCKVGGCRVGARVGCCVSAHGGFGHDVSVESARCGEFLLDNSPECVRAGVAEVCGESDVVGSSRTTSSSSVLEPVRCEHEVGLDDGSGVGRVPVVGKAGVVDPVKLPSRGSVGRKEKNRRRRERRRIAKSDFGVVDGNEDLPEWRRRCPKVVGVEAPPSGKRPTGFVGYFEGLSEDVKLELKESRARRLIAENKRKAAEDEHKERINGDPLAESLRAVISMMQIEKRVGKLANDSAIGGWAKTVASAASKTTANEQSSGGLSLASIGSTPPVDAGGLPLSQREVAYREALVRLHDHYDRRAAFSDDEVKADIQEIREAYADVCYTPAQAEKRRLYKVAEAVVLGMGGQPARQEGMLQLIEQVFEEGDEEDGKILLDSNFSKLLGRAYL